MPYSEKQRTEAREHLVRARLYKLVAWGFVIVGFFLFVVFYQMFAGGQVIRFLKNPFLIGMVLFPMIPAYAFAFMAKTRRRKAVEVLSENLEPGDMKKKRTDLYSSDKV